MKTCTCKDWQPGVEKINAYISLQFARSGGATQYTGKPFNFCPWCGKKLVDDEKDIPKVTNKDCDICGNKRKTCDRCTKIVKPKVEKILQFMRERNGKCSWGGKHTWKVHVPATGLRDSKLKCTKCGCVPYE
jgi:hypothetical protein